MVLLKVAQRKNEIQSSSPVSGIDIFNTSDQIGNSPEATYANAASLGVPETVVLHTASFTEELQSADGVFSLITSSLALHNVESEGTKRAIEALARVCEPDARVVLVYLMGYPKETLTALGWSNVTCQFAGAGSMLGTWSCQVIRVNKPSWVTYTQCDGHRETMSESADGL